MRMLDLFSGIGGFALAAEWVWGTELEIVAFCEIDKYAREVLKKRFPQVPIYEDIKELHGRQWRGEIDLITGGWPCQPFSIAGKRRGKADERYLWPALFDVIKDVRPTWFIGENVAGIKNMVLDETLADLESLGYEARPFAIPACAVGGDHRRMRIWTVAYAKESRRLRATQLENNQENKRAGRRLNASNESQVSCKDVADAQLDTKGSTFGEESNRRRTNDKQDNRDSLGNDIGNSRQDVADTEPARLQGQPKQGLVGTSELAEGSWWLSEPDVGRVAHGVPSRVDRLKCLGNAIVPQCAQVIMERIKQVMTSPISTTS